MPKTLSLETLSEYDQGSVAIMVKKALRDIYLDLEDRPLLKSARKLQLELSFKPEPAHDSAHVELSEVVSDISVKYTIPNREARTNYLQPSKDKGGMEFEPDTARAKFAQGQQTLPNTED